MVISNTDELKKQGKIQIFSCGSQRLSHKIRTELGMIPIRTYTHKKTKKIINEFIITKELSVLLEQWTKNKPVKENTNGR